MVGEYSERRCKKFLQSIGYVVGGSPGQTDLDLIAVHPASHCVDFVGEVKSTEDEDTWYPTGGRRRKEQLMQLRKLASRGMRSPLFIHFKSGPYEGRWRVYPVEDVVSMEEKTYSFVSPLKRSQGIPIELAFENAIHWAEQQGWVVEQL